MSHTTYRIAALALVSALAGGISANAQLLTHKDLSLGMAVTMATTAIETCKSQGYAVSVNVLGRNVTATVANLRTVDWQTLGINFVMVFSPGSFRGAPHADIATLTYPDGGTAAEETAMLEAAAAAFPAITIVRVKDAIEAVGGLVGKGVEVYVVSDDLTERVEELRAYFEVPDVLWMRSTQVGHPRRGRILGRAGPTRVLPKAARPV